jgi:hypothetical protein
LKNPAEGAARNAFHSNTVLIKLNCVSSKRRRARTPAGPNSLALAVPGYASLDPGYRAALYAALRSSSDFHCPRVARPFIRARWTKARCAIAIFSGLPDHAFCGAAWSARP